MAVEIRPTSKGEQPVYVAEERLVVGSTLVAPYAGHEIPYADAVKYGLVDVDEPQDEDTDEDPNVAESDAETLSEDVTDYHEGAGWYEFPDGEKRRGKDDAQEYLDALLDPQE